MLTRKYAESGLAKTHPRQQPALQNYVCVYVYTYTCMYTRIAICIYIQIHIHSYNTSKKTWRQSPEHNDNPGVLEMVPPVLSPREAPGFYHQQCRGLDNFFPQAHNREPRMYVLKVRVIL